jgi:hypothetical protein
LVLVLVFDFDFVLVLVLLLVLVLVAVVLRRARLPCREDGAMRRAVSSVGAVIGAALLCACGSSRTVRDGPSVPSCGVPASVTFGHEGGLTLYAMSFELRADGSFVATKIEHAGPDRRTSCTTRPPCASEAEVDLEKIAAALAQSDVVAAFAEAEPPTYGLDSRPADGQAFVARRSDGRGFVLGQPCSDYPGCVPIPPGITALAEMLDELSFQELARPACGAL